MNISKKNIILIITTSILSAFSVGCNSAAGLMGNMMSERESEKVTPAEFMLKDTEGKIVVFVEQPGWIKTPADIRIPLTKYINTAFTESVSIKKNRLINYTDVLNTRLQLPEDKRNEPNAIAAKLGAKYVLYIQITDFDLSTFAEKDFYNGMMKTNASLLDENGGRIWPQDASRASMVEIEDEKGTIEEAVNKLSAASAHCITRYFYNCKTIRFRVPEEHKEIENYDF